jgi:hypothetical protein
MALTGIEKGELANLKNPPPVNYINSNFRTNSRYFLLPGAALPPAPAGYQSMGMVGF